MPSLTLLDASVSNEASAALRLPAIRKHGFVGLQDLYGAFAFGTFDGATVTLQVSPDGGTSWFTPRTLNDNQVVWTVSDYYLVPLVADQVRVNVTGGNENTQSITVMLWHN